MRCPENTCDYRDKRECVKCGRPQLPPCPSPEETSRFINQLREYVKAAEPAGNEQAINAWEREAVARLARGAEEYGPRNFLSDDVFPAREAAEEAADGPNWVLGEMVKHDRWESPALWEAAFRFYQAYRALLVAEREDDD